MKIVLDTSFILSCVKEKVDFLDVDGKLLIPKQVILELEKISKEGEREERENASLALQIIDKNKEKVSVICLEKNNVDLGIIEYANGKNIAVATMDNELKRRLKNIARIVTLKKRKKIEVV